MICYPEFTYSIYVDGELPAVEAAQVERHLADCPSCRALVSMMRGENRMIATVLAEAREELSDLPEMSPEIGGCVPGRLVFGMMAALAGLILTFRSMLTGVSEWGLSQLGVLELLSRAVEWLDPSSWTAQMNILFSSIFYLVEEGATMLPWLLTAVGSVLVIATIIAVSVYIARRRPRFTPASFNTMALLGVVAVMAAPPSASAIQFEKNKTNFTVPAGTTINDSVIIGGDRATIDGDITGNLIFGGRSLKINGNVKGDVFCGTANTEINGTVGGNVISFTQWLIVNGKIGGSVYTWSQQYHQQPGGIIAGDLLTFAAESNVAGEVGRDIAAYVGAADFSGKTGRNVMMHGDNLNVTSTAKIAGDLTASLRHPDRAKIESSGSIGGKTEIKQEVRGMDSSRYSSGRFYFWQVIQWLGALLIGTLLVIFAPNFFRGATQSVGMSASQMAISLGIGFGVLVAAPVAMIILCVTLVGIPLSILMLMLYVIGMYFSKIFVGAVIGQAILQRSPKDRQDMLLALAAGLAVYFVVVNLPYAVGGILHFVVVCIGLGAYSARLAMSGAISGPTSGATPAFAGPASPSVASDPGSAA